MKRTVLVLLLVNLILSACAPASAPMPTPVPSATSLPTATTVPTSTATLTSTPTAIPTATPTPVEWSERVLIAPDNPIIFDNTNNSAYRHFPIFGSAINADGPIKVNAFLEVNSSANSPEDSSNGIWIFNGVDENVGPTSKSVVLIYQRRNWYLVYFQGKEAKIYSSLLTTSNKSGEFTIFINPSSKELQVFLPTGNIKTFQLPESFGNTVVIKAQTAPYSSLKISKLSVYQQSRQSTQIDTLAMLGRKCGITVGALADLSDWKNPKYIGILTREFSLFTVTDISQESIDRWGYAFADSAVSYARNAGKAMRGYHLIWTVDVPERWDKGNFSREQLRTIMEERITSLLKRYSAVDEWNVVNEAIVEYSLGNPSTNRFANNVWYRTFGSEYIDMAFQMARTANPNAILIYNDFGIEAPGIKTDLVYNLVKELKGKGVPIDGVGMQFHLDAAHPPSKEDMVATMRRFGDLGVSIYITELDVNLINLRGAQSEKWEKQAQVYKDVVEACVESAVCKSVTIWGVSDRFSWLLNPEIQQRFNLRGEAPLIFDENYNPKPAYFAIRDALMQCAER